MDKHGGIYRECKKVFYICLVIVTTLTITIDYKTFNIHDYYYIINDITLPTISKMILTY